MKDYEPSSYELEDSLFTLIYESCKKVNNWVENLMSLKIYELNDFLDFMNANLFHRIPHVTTQEFGEAAEVILLLE
jgi:hypothetical protein